MSQNLNDVVVNEREETCVRTSPVRINIHHPDFRRDLKFTQKTMSDLVGILANFLIVARGESYTEGDRLVSQDEVLTQQLKYAKGQNPLMVKEKLSRFYKFVIESPQNIVGSYISGMYKKDSEIGLKARINKKTGIQNDVEGGRLLCRELLLDGIFPIIPDNLPTVNYYKSAWVVAFLAVKSWEKVNKIYQQETQKINDKLDEVRENLKNTSDSIRKMGVKWLESLSDLGLRIDKKYIQKLKKIRSNLLKSICEKDIDKEIYHPFKELWEDKDYMTLIAEEHMLVKKLESRPKHARFPKLGDESSPILLSVSASNYVPVKIDCVNGAFTGSVKLINSDEPFGMRSWSFSCMKSKYFTELRTENVALKGTTVCQINYFKGNKDRVPVKATVKEPRIRQRGHHFYLDVIHNVEILSVSRMSSRQIRERASHFVFSEKSKLSDKDIAIGTKVMSVDLGINPIYSYSVYVLESKKKDADSIQVNESMYANKIVDGKEGGIRKASFHKKIVDLNKRINPLKKIIRHRSDILNDRLSNHPRYLKSVTESFAFFGWEYSENANDLKVKLLKEMSEIRKEFNVLKQRPDRCIGIMSEQMDWSALVRNFIRLLKTWKYGGHKPKDEILLKNRSWVTPNDFCKHYRYLNNYKKDVIKKIAASIRSKCVEHGVSILLVEDLEHFTFSIERDKGTNNMLEVWSPNTILRWIENAHEPHWIRVEKIDPRYSSQLDPQTGEFGYRNSFAKEFLLVKRNNKFILVNSDIAATQNLQKRFWEKFSDLHQLECIQTNDGYIPDKNKVGVRAERYLKHHAGSSTVRIVDGVLSSITAAQKNSLLRLKKSDPVKMYRHGRLWLPSEKHWEVINEMFNLFANQASLEAAERNYVSKIKSMPSKTLRRKSLLSGT